MKATILIVLLIGGLLMMTTTVSGDIDTEAPELVSLEVSPKIVNIGMVNARITVTMHARDNMSGIEHIQILMSREDGGNGYQMITYRQDFISGSDTDGIWERTFDIRRFTAPTRIFAIRVRLEDGAGNVRILVGEDLAQFDTMITVTNRIETTYIPLVAITDVEKPE